MLITNRSTRSEALSPLVLQPLYESPLTGSDALMPTSSGRLGRAGNSTAEAELKTVSGEDGVPPSSPEVGEVPVPTIRIDNEHDPFATIVCISYGDRLGELLDTVRSVM